MGERIGQQLFSRLKLMHLRPRSRSCWSGPRPFSGRAGRPEPVSVTRQRYHTPRTAGRRLASYKARAKSPRFSEVGRRLFSLDLARVAAAGRRDPSGRRLRHAART